MIAKHFSKKATTSQIESMIVNLTLSLLNSSNIVYLHFLLILTKIKSKQLVYSQYQVKVPITVICYNNSVFTLSDYYAAVVCNLISQKVIFCYHFQKPKRSILPTL